MVFLKCKGPYLRRWRLLSHHARDHGPPAATTARKRAPSAHGATHGHPPSTHHGAHHLIRHGATSAPTAGHAAPAHATPLHSSCEPVSRMCAGRAHATPGMPCSAQHSGKLESPGVYVARTLQSLACHAFTWNFAKLFQTAFIAQAWVQQGPCRAGGTGGYAKPCMAGDRRMESTARLKHWTLLMSRLCMTQSLLSTQRMLLGVRSPRPLPHPPQQGGPHSR